MQSSRSTIEARISTYSDEGTLAEQGKLMEESRLARNLPGDEIGGRRSDGVMRGIFRRWSGRRLLF